MHLGRHAFGLLVLVALTLGTAATAFADALVVVEVRTPAGEPAEGTVVLAPVGEGATRRCTTSAGTCQLENVPGGRYTVTVEPREGEAPAPRKVVIPPSGRVSLIVSTRERD